MSEISEQIIDELLEERLPSHPVRVWYDPRQKYRGIIDEVSGTVVREESDIEHALEALRERIQAELDDEDDVEIRFK